MRATLDTILALGRSTLLAVTATALLSCATPIYARRDYDRYAGQSGEKALEDLRAIAVNICSRRYFVALPRCDEMTFTDTKMVYVREDCTSSVLVHGGGSQCTGTAKHSFDFYWTDVRKIVAGSDTVKVCLKDRTCKEIIEFRNAEQAEGFAEALSTYIRRRPR